MAMTENTEIDINLIDRPAEGSVPRQAVALLVCESISESDSFVQIPFQRESIRRFAADNAMILRGEIVVELDSQSDLLAIARHVSALAAEKHAQALLVANIDLLNTSGLAGRLEPLLARNSRCIIASH